METEFNPLDSKWIALYDPALFLVEEKISDKDFNLFHTIDKEAILQASS